MLLNCGVGEDSWESLGLEVLNIHWKDWCWRWSFNTLVTCCEELTLWKRSWCWERLKAGGEGVDRGWDGWIASPTWWTWVWASFRTWWWIGKPGVLQSLGFQRVGQGWVTKLTWRNLILQMKRMDFQVYVPPEPTHKNFAYLAFWPFNAMSREPSYACFRLDFRPTKLWANDLVLS